MSEEIKVKSKDLYRDIKDLSFIVQSNFEELTKEQNNSKDKCDKVADDFYQNKSKIDYDISSINSKLEEVSLFVQEKDNRNSLLFKEVDEKIKTEKYNLEVIVSTLKEEFNFILSEQQRKHDEEVQMLKNHIKQLEYDLREEMKSPIKKLIDKYQNKQEK